MDVQHYKNFITIVEEGNLTSAAKKLHIAQPALTNQLKSLEYEYGTILMKRGSRKIELNDSGKLLLEKAKYICEIEASAKKEILDMINGSSGILRIGITPSNSYSFLDGTLQKYHDLYPDVKYELYETGTSEITELLKHGVIEIGITRTPFQSSDEFQVMYTGKEKFVAVYGTDCNYFDKEKTSITIKELMSVPVCMIRRFMEMYTDICRVYGFSPNYTCISTQLSTNLLWAKNNMGVAIVPLSAFLNMKDSGLLYKLIENDNFTTSRALITIKGRYLSKNVKNFMSLYEAITDERIAEA
jgi:LysR family transcriptional regulator, salicylic acid-responsive activator of bsdBCD